MLPPAFSTAPPLPLSKVIPFAVSIPNEFEDVILKFVPSPSIFSPSSPNVNPMFAGMLTSAPAFKSMSPVPLASSSRLLLDAFAPMVLSVIVTPSTSNDAIFRLPASIVIPPDLSAAVAVVVPKTKVSADSSHIIAALLPVVPLSIMIPASFNDCEIPVFNSIRLSSIVVLVELTVVVSPLTVKFPVIDTAPLNVAPALNVAAPASLISKVKAVITAPPSSPLNIMSPSVASTLKTALELLF